MWVEDVLKLENVLLMSHTPCFFAAERTKRSVRHYEHPHIDGSKVDTLSLGSLAATLNI